MTAVNFEELNKLAGELLPERAVLSAFGGGYDGGGYDGGGHDGGGGNGGATVVSTCATQSTSPALVLGLPLGAQQITQICTPSTVTH
ncbi:MULTISPECIES: hypothetical protein [Streptomyces]|uniref:Uncharacterized protein n=2 Tax=Streptomyces TaxID=1883 RepID=A0A100Y261_9ACTN|nr:MULTISPECIES: hypothetical protein [Streptomyces]KUH36312.1 hypothetical protein ATE80_24275 [Streptomyces kanasensis]UUS35122.1 hypothetical protein NRO40_30450 [Streptomyces changanensis]